jgi:hypothetical protein
MICGAIDMTDETDVPIGGLDEWWRAAASSADVAEREKQAIASEDFAAHRAARYLESGGTDQIVGGWARPSGMGRCNDYGRWPRMIGWT